MLLSKQILAMQCFLWDTTKYAYSPFYLLVYGFGKSSENIRRIGNTFEGCRKTLEKVKNKAFKRFNENIFEGVRKSSENLGNCLKTFLEQFQRPCKIFETRQNVLEQILMR